MSESLELVRRGWEAARGGDLDTISGLLADDVRWHAAGDQAGGCQNRDQALRWMRAGMARGAGAEVLEIRELAPDEVLVVLQRPGADPHAQVVHVRDGKIAEMVVFPTPDDALAAGDR